ncbi:hypothetical protein IE077_004259 [Cardiosporidium cionae]|uniref:RAP domain-containing protein n=1 Tax=Cardiosporidium cionae TaxID=476202 RepID=A0ABQ7JCY0_9APIC|nr:hypothetical protein IE077_004259 [Cardiosporidium cionae]|eukprot:KAF8821872.1 hypothetical protein IE077_004259 [Cardiosporidium cionae]
MENLITLLRMLAELVEVDAMNQLAAKDMLALQSEEPQRSAALLSRAGSLPFNDSNKPYERFSEIYREIPTINEIWKEDLAGIHHGRSMAEWIIRDERYDLLLQDLHKHRTYLDFESLAVVVISLKVLQHKHFQVLSSFIRPLLEKSSQLIDITGEEERQQFETMDESNASKTSLYEVYVWAGYIQIPFYDRCASLLVREFKKLEVAMHTNVYVDNTLAVVSASATSDIRRSFESVDNAETSSIKTTPLNPLIYSSLYPSLLVNAVALFGSLEVFNRSFFETSEKIISFYAGDYQNSRNPFSYLTASDFTSIACAFTAHSLYSPFCDSVLTRVANILVNHSEHFEINEIASCICSFRKVSLKYPRAIVVLCNRLNPYVTAAYNLRQKCNALTTDNLCEILEACTYFGQISTVDTQIDVGKEPVTALCGAILSYLEDSIDDVSEKAAIQAVFSMSAVGLADQHAYLLSFLYRKIGYGKAWESLKVPVFQIWLCHMLQFPWLSHNMPLRCVNEGLRAWCLQRGGYGAPFPQEISEISDVLSQQNIQHRLYEQIDCPYALDIVLEGEGLDRKLLFVVAQCSHNSLEPCGGALLQIQHLKQLGYISLAIKRNYWRNLDEQRKYNYIEDVIDALQAL